MNTKAIIQATLAGTLAAAVLTAGPSPMDAKAKRAATQAFMHQKLFYSQGILEGLALEKYDLITKNALRMRKMTDTNMWFSLQEVAYMKQTTNFQKSMDTLYMAAVDKNLDAATEAYLSVSRNCVDCHRIVRGDQRKNAPKADIAKPQPPLVVQ